MLPSLPIDPLIPEVVAALRAAGSVVLHAPPGAGKTTRVPPALVDAGWGQVVVLEPRRVAARAAATRIASERGVRPGTEVGWQVRHDRRAGPDTRLLVVTEGVLLRRLQDDPFLEGVGAVVLDEFHERSLLADLALAMLRRVRDDARDDLRLVVMSATLDVEPVAAFLGAPVVRSTGRAHPVELRWDPRPADDPVDRVAGEARALVDETGGGVLCFLPGVRDIHRAAEALRGVTVHRLHGSLPLAEQQAVLRPHAGPRVVLATNVAETSVTVDGVRAVVDTGLAKTLWLDPGSGLDRLVRGPVSRASADQRAGRAGRQGPGICRRLWTERSHTDRPAHELPALQREDLAGAVLQLLAWGEDPRRFPWLEPPPEHRMALAHGLLRDLGLADAWGVTPDGARVARWPLHPRLGRFLVEAERLGGGSVGALAAAMLAGRDPLVDFAAPPTDCDLAERVEALGPGGRVRQDARQLARRVEGGRDLRALRPAAWAAWPDRLVRRSGPRRGVMVGGRGVVLSRRSGVDAPLMVAMEVREGGSEARVELAAAVDPGWVDTAVAVELAWDGERVQALERTRYRDLVLGERPSPVPRDEAAAAVLADGVGRDVVRALGLTEGELRRWWLRVCFLARRRPDLGLPDLTEAGLRGRLPELCLGLRSASELRRAAADRLRGLLRWDQREALGRLAPERLQVPSGSRVRLDYPDDGGAPVLAVRMQELFGLGETPRVAGVPVRLHLLAPSGRPQQVTDDLAGFWERTWPEVRKELRGRYPKHAWPEDPLAAAPMRGAKRRRSGSSAGRSGSGR